MILSISASQASFKALTFRPGLNIIVADRAVAEGEDKGSSRRSRNGAGKSSIIDVVHFLLGGSAEGALESAALATWSFSGQFRERASSFEVTRAILTDRQVVFREAEGKAVELTASKWAERLGQEWFSLTRKREAGAASFRQMMAYFARRRRDGGFDEPTRTFRQSPSSSIETNLAELFGLDSELVRRLHKAKADKKAINAAQKALASLEKKASKGERRVDLEAQLEAQIATITTSRNSLQKRVEEFNVLPQFRELERELSALNRSADALSDQDVVDAELLAVSQESLSAESIETVSLVQLFDEAKVVFPKLVTQRYEDVLKFHRRLVENRREHLLAEMTAARRRIDARSAQREALESRRRQIATALRASGPAENLLRLRDELSSQDSDLSALKTRLAEARKLDEQAAKVDAELEEAVRALKQDRRERSAIVDQASRTFAEISQRLYSSPGQLVISANDSGLGFLPKAPADKSAGVMSMEIFCFDWTIAQLCAARGVGPGFLIHDSHLFEPVDGRQFAEALRTAASLSEANGVQYIVLLNSDELARAEVEGEADFSQFVLETKLSDTEDGGLFGIRFD